MLSILQNTVYAGYSHVIPALRQAQDKLTYGQAGIQLV
jgi:hypothetical protein